jgi:chromosome segregation ATPase
MKSKKPKDQKMKNRIEDTKQDVIELMQIRYDLQKELGFIIGRIDCLKQELKGLNFRIIELEHTRASFQNKIDEINKNLMSIDYSEIRKLYRME